MSGLRAGYPGRRIRTTARPGVSPVRVILAIDQAASSGVAIAVLSEAAPVGAMTCLAPRVHALVCGVARSTAERQDHLRRAIGLVSIDGGSARDLWVVREDHSKVPARHGRPVATVLGLGAAWGRWETLLDLAHVAVSHRRSVAPAVWRRAVLGPGVDRLRGEQAKAKAVRWASAALGHEVEHDAAEALAIAAWAGANLPLQIEYERAQSSARRRSQ